MESTAILLAAGTGSRMQNEGIPKQFLEMLGDPIVVHTLTIFDTCKAIDRIVVVCHPDYLAEMNALVTARPYRTPITVIAGGQTRQDSVLCALTSLSDNPPDIVVIHDAVRPFISHEIIERSIEGAVELGAADVCVKTTDTIVEVEGDRVVGVLDRDRLYNGQTPQTFRFSVIRDAHHAAIAEQFTETTDDVKLVLRYGGAVKLVLGSYENIKLTTPFDIHLANLIHQQRSEVLGHSGTD